MKPPFNTIFKIFIPPVSILYLQKVLLIHLMKCVFYIKYKLIILFSGDLLMWDLRRPGKHKYDVITPSSSTRGHQRIVFNICSPGGASGHTLVSISMDRQVSGEILQGKTLHGKQGKWPPKNSCQRTQGIFKFCQNRGNFVCSRCTFPDSNSESNCNICHGNFHLFLEVKYVCQINFVYIITTNHII